MAQTYENFEILVVNDGSNDAGKTEKIALSYGEKIRYFSKENGGVATALNLALREMKGEYFSWLSHDDFYYPQKLQRQMEALQACKDPERIVISDYDLYDQLKKTFSHYHMRAQYARDCIENSVFSVLQGLVSGCSMLIHRSHFIRVGNFDERLRTTQDYDLWFRMFRGQRLLYLPECVMAVRVHPAQGINTVPTHKEEQNVLCTKFVKSLSDSEIISLYSSRGVFYSQILSLLWGGRIMEAYRYTNALFQKEPVPEELSENLREFREYLAGLSGGKAKRICIFCAGNWGIRLYHELTSRVTHVDFFCDNDTRKHGYVLESAWCISLEELERLKDETLVIVSTARPDPIVRQLTDMGFPYVIKKQDLSQKLFTVPRAKWMTALDSLEEVDYTSAQTEALVSQFKKTIFEICTYYETKLGGFQ